MPVQEFIGNGLGMPLYMEPNFEDLSCKMMFGQPPPLLQDDPVMTESCFSRCNLANAFSQEQSCHSMTDTEQAAAVKWPLVSGGLAPPVSDAKRRR